MKAYKILSVIIIVIVTLPLIGMGMHIYEDYKEFKSCRNLREYKRYSKKQKKLYPNIFQNKALEIYTVKKREMIKKAQTELFNCTTIEQYSEFIKKYESYYEDESEIQNLINEAFYRLYPLEVKEYRGKGIFQYTDIMPWLRRIDEFSIRHPSAEKLKDYKE